MSKAVHNRRPCRNHLLAVLPSDEVELLRPDLEEVPITLRKSLYEANRPIQHLYFPHRGVISLVTDLEDRSAVEVATIGPEGFVGLPVFLGAAAMASRAFVQIPGEAARIETNAFRRAVDAAPTLRLVLARYTLAFVNQLAQSGACYQHHSVEERCACWLLMTHDRMAGDPFALTHELMAQMLGVQRPTVSIAAKILSRAGLISYVHGKITILDRPGLEAVSCECYRVISHEFETLAEIEH
jgi:CRP-like cAMP-binding protein